MHMLTKSQVFYDESHKTALGYQNPFYLSQARWKVPTLYDGNTIVKTHVALSVTDIEETLALAEESRLKMLAKQNDPSLKKHKVNLKLVDYVALNKLLEHFAKHFDPRKQLSAEQAYWLHILKSVSEKPLVPSEPVLKKEIPREHPSISLLSANNNCLDNDNNALELLKMENDGLIELLISQDLVHTTVNSLAAINDYKMPLHQILWINMKRHLENFKLSLANKTIMI
ncbi:hypothetical protein Tco_0482283 [Tanacetum coccineum]